MTSQTAPPASRARARFAAVGFPWVPNTIPPVQFWFLAGYRRRLPWVAGLSDVPRAGGELSGLLGQDELAVRSDAEPVIGAAMVEDHLGCVLHQCGDRDAAGFRARG